MDRGRQFLKLTNYSNTRVASPGLLIPCNCITFSVMSFQFSLKHTHTNTHTHTHTHTAIVLFLSSVVWMCVCVCDCLSCFSKNWKVIIQWNITENVMQLQATNSDAFQGTVCVCVCVHVCACLCVFIQAGHIIFILFYQSLLATN